MKNDEYKSRTAIWLYPKTITRMDESLTAANCKNRSEYIEQALEFYTGYIESRDATPFLSKAILSSVEGTLRMTENRVANNLFRLSVEVDMMMHLLATTLDISDEQLRSLRSLCVSEVKKTRGKISLDNAIDFQQSPDDEE